MTVTPVLCPHLSLLTPDDHGREADAVGLERSGTRSLKCMVAVVIPVRHDLPEAVERLDQHYKRRADRQRPRVVPDSEEPSTRDGDEQARQEQQEWAG
jgi:hypothetical protein